MRRRRSRTGPRQFASPRLSPDGQRLAVSVTEGEQQNIWVYQLGNEMFRPVTFDGLNNAPLWTPDGLRLTYYVRGGTAPSISSGNRRTGARPRSR